MASIDRKNISRRHLKAPEPGAMYSSRIVLRTRPRYGVTESVTRCRLLRRTFLIYTAVLDISKCKISSKDVERTFTHWPWHLPYLPRGYQDESVAWTPVGIEVV